MGALLARRCVARPVDAALHTETRYVALKRSGFSNARTVAILSNSRSIPARSSTASFDPAFLPWQPWRSAPRWGRPLSLADSFAAGCRCLGCRPRGTPTLPHPPTASMRRRRLQLHALPWELLYDGATASHTPLAMAATDATPFSHAIWPAPGDPAAPFSSGGIKVLAACSTGRPGLAGDGAMNPVAEVNALLEAVQGLDVEVTLFRPCRPIRRCPRPGGTYRAHGLQQAAWSLPTLEAELRGAHILHLVAHGTFDNAGGHGFLVLPTSRTMPSPSRTRRSPNSPPACSKRDADELDPRGCVSSFWPHVESPARSATDVFAGWRQHCGRACRPCSPCKPRWKSPRATPSRLLPRCWSIARAG